MYFQRRLGLKWSTVQNVAAMKHWTQLFTRQGNNRRKSYYVMFKYEASFYKHVLNHKTWHACAWSKIRCSSYPRHYRGQTKNPSQTQISVPREAIQVVSHWNFLPHLEYPHRCWGICNTKQSQNEPNVFQATWRKRSSTTSRKWICFDVKVGWLTISNDSSQSNPLNLNTVIVS